eukprot:augustus_masked-scaffold_2-processed-gene-11.46-mRNA-1 protein AED:1.00 eAED:1.00 QI:0/-1/0/0/-1/1/1/0/913
MEQDRGTRKKSWRVSLPPKYPTIRTLRNVVKSPEDLKNTSFPGADSLPSSNLFTARGVSLEFLNLYWRKVLGNERYPGLQLFTLKEDIYEESSRSNSPDLLDTADLNQSKSRQTAVYNRLEKAKRTILHANETVQLLEKVSRSPRTARVKSSSGKFVTVQYSKLTAKKRSDWTLTDIRDFCLLEDLQISNAPFADRLKDSRYSGEPFNAIYLIYPPDCKFENVLRSIRQYISEQGNNISFAAFFWLDVFCLNLNSVKEYELNPKKNSHQIEAFNKRLIEARKTVALNCKERYIYFDDWKNPSILQYSESVFDLWQVFSNNISFEILTLQKLQTGFSDVYDFVEQKDSEYEMDGIFSVFQNFDPSTLKCSNLNLRKTLEKWFTNPSTFENGISTLTSTLSQKISEVYCHDVEEDVRTLYVGKDFSSGKSFADLLIRAGNFMHRKGHVSVAKSYIQKSIKIFSQLEKLLNQRYREDLKEKSKNKNKGKQNPKTARLRKQVSSGAEKSVKSIFSAPFTLARPKKNLTGYLDPVTGEEKRTVEEQFNLDVVQLGLCRAKTSLAKIVFAETAEMKDENKVAAQSLGGSKDIRRSKEVMKLFSEAENHAKSIWSHKQPYFISIFLARAQINVELAEFTKFTANGRKSPDSERFRMRALTDYEAVLSAWRSISNEVEFEGYEGRFARVKYLRGLQLKALGRLDEAATAFSEAEKLQAQYIDPGNLKPFKHLFLEYCDTLKEIGIMEFKQKNFYDAHDSFCALEDFCGWSVGTCNERYAKVSFLIGQTLANLEKYPQALNKFDNSIKIYEMVKGPKIKEIAICYSSIGKIYVKQEEFPQAEQSYLNALSSLSDSDFSQFPIRTQLGEIHYARGQMFDKAKEKEKAIEAFGEALEWRQKIYSEDHPLVQRTQAKLKQLGLNV